MSMPIEVKVNGKLCSYAQALSVDQLLKELGYTDHFVAVAVNSQCVLRRDYASHLIQGHDEIEILAPMAGG
jgi:thiamine biosynthesis protein ThiS